jgi:choline dehydrogenase-like flavoprotein
VSGLWVADASTFPTATGVNPMITTEAIAYMVAKGVAATAKGM